MKGANSYPRVYVCVCVYVCEAERERGGEIKTNQGKEKTKIKIVARRYCSILSLTQDAKCRLFQ